MQRASRQSIFLAASLTLACRPLAQIQVTNPSATPAIEAAEIPGMGYVPAGDFWMGRVRLWLIDEIGWQVRDRADDRPVHKVYLDGFYMERHEVTNSEYAEFVQATGRTPPYQWGGSTPPADRAQIPIYNVSWHEAVAYCDWRGRRLPTEAEWEKAARGGLDRQDYPWGMQYEMPALGALETSVILIQAPGPAVPVDPDSPVIERIDDPAAPAAGPDATAASLADSSAPPAGPETVAHAWSASAIGPTTVATFEPNDYGLHDMSGNVWEWTSDWYDLYAYSVSARRNPHGPLDGRYKVIRGGGWADDEIRLGTVYYRNFANPDERAPTIGFRCAMSAHVPS